jgi:hypothetical protein
MPQYTLPTPHSTWRSLYKPLSASTTSTLNATLTQLSNKRNDCKGDYDVALSMYGDSLPSEIGAQHRIEMRALSGIRVELRKIVDDVEVLDRGAELAMERGDRPRDTIRRSNRAALEGKTWVEAQRYLLGELRYLKERIERI